MHIVWSFRSLTTWSSVPGTLLTDSQENCQGTHGINHISPEVPWTLNKTFWKDPFTGAINITATFCIWEFHRFVAFTELPIPIHVYLRWRWNKLLIFKRNLVRGLGVHLARGPVTWFRLQRCEWYMNISSRFSRVFNRFCHTSTCVLYHHLRWSIPSAHDGKWCTICSWPPQAQFWRFCQSRCRGQKGPIPKKGTSRVQDKWNGWGDRVHPWGSW